MEDPMQDSKPHLIAGTVFFIVALLLGTSLRGNMHVQEKAKTVTQAVAFPFKASQISEYPPDSTVFMPLHSVDVKKVSDTWGAPRSGGRRHQGQDIFASRGTPVYSATYGYVLRIGQDRLGGNVVWILGAGGRRYYYAHLDRFNPELKRFQEVTPMTVLGYVGTSGNAEKTPPHLHFGIYTNSGAINPLPLLRNWSR